VDILFGDFLRALVTADSDLFPEDEVGYRAALIDAFRARGIVPEGVVSYSEEALRWCPPEWPLGLPEPARCAGLSYEAFSQTDEARKARNKENARCLYRFAKAHAEVLGLDPGSKIQVLSFHNVHRVGPSERVDFCMYAELCQRRPEPLDSNDPDAGMFEYRGGTTVILERDGSVRYAIRKSLSGTHSAARLARIRAYRAELAARAPAAAYALAPRLGDPPDFRHIHRGY